MILQPLTRIAYSTLASLSLMLAPISIATAAAPQVKTPAPGYYRMMLGAFEVTALSDGTVDLKIEELLTNTTAAKIRTALTRARLKDPVETSVNAYLINTGSKLVMIDAGAGVFFGPTLGKLIASLKASGYQPEQVDEIYITHMHSDHVGGLVNGDKMAFPNAVVRADRRDADFWLSKANMDTAPKEAKPVFEGAMASINPYIAAGKFKPFDGNTDLGPGVSAIATYGHTPGHTVYMVESQGQRLVFWGDLMHVAAVQFAEPSVTIRFDSDNKAAAAQRKKQYADAAKRGHWVAAAHLPFPGIGHLRADGKGYDWLPANYTALR
jgi:glyoxylase-like metal-dependent hydrolase (beta-lactamase superfamily II)